MYLVVGLGNPGAEYKKSRHNVGMMALEHVRAGLSFPLWEEDSKARALISSDTVGGESIVLMLPQAFMNRSGGVVKTRINNVKEAEKLVVIYDDLDLPLGKLRVSFGKSSGGHKGIDSIITAVRTKNFVRIRLGVSPTTPSGMLRKPTGEEAVLDFLMGDNRKESSDSRLWGALPENFIVGRALVRLLPIDAVELLPGSTKHK